MTGTRVPLRRPAALLAVLLLASALGSALAGCSSMADAPATGASGASGAAPSHAASPGTTGTAGDPAASESTGAPAELAMAEVPVGSMHMPTADEVTSTWQARPDYVKGLPDAWQQAYAFALARPDVLQWLPCYCGCAGMEHRSNLDCFFQRREVQGNYAYEEHASFCDICVQTANMASQMLREGKTMVQIRAAVDTELGGGAAPGTDTPRPPAS